MNKNKENKICVFCAIDSNGFKAIDDDLREILGVVFYKVDWNKGNQISFVCHDCYTKILKAFQFKTECLYVENKIVSHMSLEQPQVDLKEVYFKKQDQQLMKIEDDHRICRFCLRLVNEFISHQEIEPEIIKKCVPEVNFNITLDPAICTPCFESLLTYGIFIETCMDVHEHGLNTFEPDVAKSDVTEDNEILEDVSVKTEKPDTMDDEESDTTVNIEPDARVEEKRLFVELEKLV